MKVLFSLILVFTLNHGMLLPSGDISDTYEGASVKKHNRQENFLDNGLLPLPKEGVLVVPHLPLPTEPPPSPETMLHRSKDRKPKVDKYAVQEKNVNN